LSYSVHRDPQITAHRATNAMRGICGCAQRRSRRHADQSFAWRIQRDTATLV